MVGKGDGSEKDGVGRSRLVLLEQGVAGPAKAEREVAGTPSGLVVSSSHSHSQEVVVSRLAVVEADPTKDEKVEGQPIAPVVSSSPSAQGPVQPVFFFHYHH